MCEFPVLEILTQLHPISGLLHVGAGNGAAIERYRRWSAKRVVLVEADEQRAEKLNQAVMELDGYRALHALVAGIGGEAPFFVASNRSESGLVDPQSLTGVWRNLKALECKTREACTIDALLQPPPGQVSAGGLNWLVVDCLPALAILRGAEMLLKELDVVVARAVVDDTLGREVPDSAKADLDAFLGERGFRLAGVEPERHPAIADIVYLRDWKQQFRLAHDVAEQTSREYRQALEANGEQAELARKMGEELTLLQTQLHQYVQQAETSAEALKGPGADHEQLERWRQEADEALAGTRQAEEQLRLEKATVTGLEEKLKASEARNAELAARVTAFEQELGEGREKLKASEARNTELTATVPGLEKRVNELTQELSTTQEEMKQERARLADEFARAEAQIDLIKTLVAGPGDA